MSRANTTILLVRKDPGDARKTARFLEERGYNVILSPPSGRAAARAAKNHDPDIMVLDAPPDGLPATLSMPHGRDIPLLFITTRDDADFYRRIKKTACRGVLREPFDGEALEWAVDNALSHNDITRKREAGAAPRLSEDNYRSLVENINEIIYVLDPAGTITYISPVIERRYHWKPEEMLGRHYSEFIHPDDMAVASRGGRWDEEAYAVPVEYRAVDRGGNIVYLRSSSRPFYVDGKLAGETGVLTDITEEKLAEKTILAQRDLAVKLSASLDAETVINAVLETALDLPGIAYCAVHMLNGDTGELEPRGALGGAGFDGTILKPFSAHRFTEAMENRGLGASEACLQMLPARSRKRIQKAFGRWECLPVKKEGETFALVTAASLAGEGIPGNTLVALGAIVAQMADATGRLNVIDGLKKNNEFLATVLDNMRDLVVIFDFKKQSYIYVNAHTRQHYGIEPDEYMTMALGSQLSRGDARMLLRVLKDEIDHDRERDPNRVREFILLERHRSGRCFWAQLRATFLRDHDGAPAAILNIVRDISEKIQADEELRYRNEFEDLITRISIRFINLPAEKVDRGVNEALRSIGRFAGVDRSYIFLMSDDGSRTSNTHEWCAPGIDSQKAHLQDLPVEEFPWFLGGLSRSSELYIPDIDAMSAGVKKEKRFLKKQGIKSLVAVPMMSKKKLRGFIGFDSVREKKTWPKDTIDLLRIVAEIFVNLLNRQESERSLRIYERIVSSSRDMILFVDEGHRVRAANDEFCAMFKIKARDIVGSRLDTVFSGGVYESILKDQLRYSSAGREARFEMWYDLPGLDQRCLDVAVSPFREKKNLVSGFIINCRDITERIQTEAKVLGVIESERRKIGMELHDGLSHRLLGVAIRGKMLSEKLKEDLPETADGASIIEESINACIGEVRDLARGLNPFRHEHISLEDRVEELCTLVSAKFGIQCGMECVTPLEISALGKVEQVYYIIHEAIINAVKHSGARKVTVLIESADGTAVCTVRDDGGGMPRRDRRVKGLGLDIMRYRARMIGATLKIKSGKKNGTQIQCSFRQ